MRSNYLIHLEQENISFSFGMRCTLGQANKTFISLSFALAGNGNNYKSVSLFLVGKGGEMQKINGSKFI